MPIFGCEMPEVITEQVVLTSHTRIFDKDKA